MNIPLIAWRNLFRNKRRSLLCLSAIGVATLSIVFMFAVIEGMRFDQRATAQRFTTGEARLRNPGYEQYQFTYPEEFLIPDYQGVLAALKRLPELSDHSGRLQFPAQVAVSWQKVNPGTTAEYNLFDQTVAAVIVGLDFPVDTDFFSMQPFLVKGGRLPGENEVVVAEGFAKKNGINVHDTIFIFAGNDSRRLTVSGLVSLPVSQLGQKAVYLPLMTAQELLARDNQATEILLRFKDPARLSANIAAVKQALGQSGRDALEVKAWDEIGFVSAYLDMASATMNLVALFFFVIATTVIVNTTMMVIYERMREIGTLRALGMTGRQMISLFFMEAFFLSLAAAVLGVAVGSALVLPLSISGLDLGKLADVGKMNLSLSNVIYPQINLSSTLFVLVYAVVVASVITFIPTRRAASIEPVEALRSI
jgi:putative ABC transport system permease protein